MSLRQRSVILLISVPHDTLMYTEGVRCEVAHDKVELRIGPKGGQVSLPTLHQASGFRLHFRLQASGFRLHRLQASGFRLQASGFTGFTGFSLHFRLHFRLQAPAGLQRGRKKEIEPLWSHSSMYHPVQWGKVHRTQ